MKDKWTNNLAVGLLIVFFIYFGIALVDGLFLSSTNDYSGIKEISTALGFIPGAILGYYFQQGRIQSLGEQVQREKREALRAKSTVARTSKLSPSKNKEIEVLKELLKTKDNILDRQKKTTTGGKDIVKTVNENVGISEDVELKKLLEKDQELQKQVEELDKKTREEDEALQREIASLLEEPY